MKFIGQHAEAQLIRQMLLKIACELIYRPLLLRVGSSGADAALEHGYFQRIDARQRLHTVGRLADDLAVVRRPVEQALEALAYHYLVVHEQDPQFLHRASSVSGSLTGRNMCAVTPPLSFSVYERPYSRPQSSFIRFCTFSTPMLLPSSFAGWRA